MTGSPENYKGQYAGLKFDPYKFREFPKVIYSDEGKVLGTAANAREENELYASIGVVKADIDPLGAAQDEIAQLREQLAKFEAGASPTVKKTGVRTETVKMLPENTANVQGVAQTGQNALTSTQTGKAGQNPLLKPVQNTGNPSPVGTAPKVDTQISPGV